MSWSSSKKAFRAKLNNQPSAFLSLCLSQEERDRRNKIVIKSRCFLSSVEELRNHFYNNSSVNKVFWEKLVEAATEVIPPTNNRNDDYKELCRYLNRLNHDMNARAVVHHEIAFKNAVCLSFSTLLLAFNFVMGATLLIVVAAGVSTLAVGGPWGIAVLGAALVFLGAFGGCYCAYKAYENVRFCRKSQLKELNDFVDYFKPNPEVERTNELSDVLLYEEKWAEYEFARDLVIAFSYRPNL